jgi:transcription elongation GreA/GreB family factor
MRAIDKLEALQALTVQLEGELDAARVAQRQTQAGATHEESKPENDKDTRALEASYLARGQAQRVVELEEALTKVNSLGPREFAPDTPVALGAIVQLQDEDAAVWYLLAPAGGGVRLQLGTTSVTVVTPESPVGKALLGRRAGDDIDIRTPQGLREYSVSTVL